jgi:hypothetical protein
LHGAVREQGLTSSPTPEIHVRVAWACAATGKRNNTAQIMLDMSPSFLILLSIK